MVAQRHSGPQLGALINLSGFVSYHKLNHRSPTVDGAYFVYLRLPWQIMACSHTSHNTNKRKDKSN
jgi:hypothetical protein